MRMALKNSFGLISVLAGLIALFSLSSEYFFSWLTLQTILNQIPALTVISVGMTLVLIIAGIDLSVGSTLALAGAVTGVIIVDFDAAFSVALIGGVAIGGLVGFINGLLSSYWRIPSFVVTLGMLEIARGAAYQVTDSQTKYLGSQVESLGAALPGVGISLSLVVALLVVIVGQWVLSKTVFGRYIIAIGTNEKAVYLSGINAKKIKMAVFIIAGTLAGLAGVLQLSYLQSADPNAGIGMELSAIAAVVIGGTSLMGGRGSVVNAFLGVLIIAVIQTGLAQLGISEPMKRVVTGSVIIAAVLLDAMRGKGSLRPKAAI